MWKQDRSERARNPKEVKDRAHLRAIVQSLEQGETLRLIDGDRPYFHSGAIGGFVVPRRTFDIPLIILGGFREGEGIRIKIAALDIDEGLVGIFHSLGYDHDEKKMRAPYLTRIDTTLGQSDAIQIGDLLERGE